MREHWKAGAAQTAARAFLYLKTLAKWLVLASVTGGLCGLVGTAFHVGVEYATELRGAHRWLLWCLPAAGLGIVALYKLCRTEGRGTNDVIDEVRQGKGLPFLLLPSIFVGTLLTHLCGGSAGREGAALQMGGTIGYHMGKVLHLDDQDLRTITMTGMAAFFSALFGTPVAAALFAILVVSVGAMYHENLFPCLVAALVAYGVSIAFGVAPTSFAVTAPDMEVWMLIRVAVLAGLCGLVSILLCATIHVAEHLLGRWFPNAWIRIVAGAAMVIALTYLLGTTDYNGAGMNVITRAIEEGKAAPVAFLWKILLTAVTLGAGFKGGEVVPSFFAGATFGCVVGPILGIPAGFGAAVGLTAVFCGAVNSPVTAMVLAVELFGAEGLLFYALSCSISFVLSGYSGLYSSQTILFSKLKAQYIHVQANGYKAGDPDRKP